MKQNVPASLEFLRGGAVFAEERWVVEHTCSLDILFLPASLW